MNAYKTSWLAKGLNDAWRKMVFFCGDVRRLGTFPWVTWDVHLHQVKFDEILEALPLVRYGDIGVHRDSGYLSNLAIPGFMKHAWIHTDDGISKPFIVEAISEGVVKRSAIYPLYSDYALILGPREEGRISQEHRKGACTKANQIVGVRYDHNFAFDIEEELKYYEGKDAEDGRQHLAAGNAMLSHYDHGFSCTEVVSYSWWHQREDLKIFRSRSRGKSVILADSFLSRSWKIRWASKSVTVDAAHKLGLGEEGLSLIEEYRR